MLELGLNSRSNIIRLDKGSFLSEEEMIARGINPTRVAKIVKCCLQTGAWQFDEYEQDLVLYRVALDRQFASGRTAT